MRIVSVRRIEGPDEGHQYFEIVRERGWFRVTREWADVRWNGAYDGEYTACVCWWGSSEDVCCPMVGRAVQRFVRFEAIQKRDGVGRWRTLLPGDMDGGPVNVLPARVRALR